MPPVQLCLLHAFLIITEAFSSANAANKPLI